MDDNLNKMEHTKEKSIFYPPGGILIWIVIYLELITFGLAIIALAMSGAADREAFHQDSEQLNRTIALINTILLLTAGYLAAKGVQQFKLQQIQKSERNLLWAILCGCGFLLLKCFEYFQKLELGLGMDASTFYMFYWLLTGFHWVHVLVGLVILVAIRRNIIKIKADAVAIEDVEAGVTFWHLCDLIWLFLFPVLYMLF